MAPSSRLAPLVRRLSRSSGLHEADRERLLALPFEIRVLDPLSYLIREGETPRYCISLLSGFASRHKITGNGLRQILSVHLSGEFVDLQNLYLEVADHNVQALTRLEAALVPIGELRALAAEQPRIARALWLETLIEASVFREWIVNVGRRDSITRISHLLCEFALRLRDAELAGDGTYELPMTQEQLADATGLTSVHVNRVLQDLGRRGLIKRDRRSIAILDWGGLEQLGDFSVRYLHLAEAQEEREVEIA